MKCASFCKQASSGETEVSVYHQDCWIELCQDPGNGGQLCAIGSCPLLKGSVDQAELGMQLLRLTMEAQLIDMKPLDARPGMELLRLTMKLQVIKTMSLDVHLDMRPLRIMKLQLATMAIDMHLDMRLQVATTITETDMSPLHLNMKLQWLTTPLDTHPDMQLQVIITNTETDMQPLLTMKLQWLTMHLDIRPDTELRVITTEPDMLDMKPQCLTSTSLWIQWEIRLQYLGMSFASWPGQLLPRA